MKRCEVLAFVIGGSKVEITFIMNDKWRNPACHRMLGKLFKTGVPEAADGMPGFEIGPDQVAPLATDGIGGVILCFVASVGRSESRGPVNDGEPSALIHELFEGFEVAIGRMGIPSIRVDDKSVVC